MEVVTSVEINKRQSDVERLVTLCKIVIDQANMGDYYLISFVKRELWEEFREVVERLDVGA